MFGSLLLSPRAHCSEDQKLKEPEIFHTRATEAEIDKVLLLVFTIICCSGRFEDSTIGIQICVLVLFVCLLVLVLTI